MKRQTLSSVTARLALGIAALGFTACGSDDEAGGDDNRSGGAGGAASGSGGTRSGSGGSGAAAANGGLGGGIGSGGSIAGSGGFAGSVGGSGSGGSGTGGSGGSGAGGSGGAGSGGEGTGQGGSATGGLGGTSTGGNGGSGGATTGGPNSMGWIGCSMGENVATGYRRIGGTRMWGPYGNGGAVVQQWTNTNSMAWQRFDNQAEMHGPPTAVWIMICIFTQGATAQEVRQLIQNAREHAAPGATIYITGQPGYEENWTCSLAGATGPELTDRLAREAADDAELDVIYPGQFGPLGPSTVLSSDGTRCHANTDGENLLGQQAMDFWQ